MSVNVNLCEENGVNCFMSVSEIDFLISFKTKEDLLKKLKKFG